MDKNIAPKTKANPGVSLGGIVRRFRKGYVALQEKRKAGLYPMAMPMGFPFAVSSAMELKKKVDEEEFQMEEGIEIPTKYTPIFGAEDKIKRPSLKKVNMVHSLIPRMPKAGEDIFAYANIRWEPSTGEVLYNVVEPPLSGEDKLLIERIKKILEEKLDVDFVKVGNIKAKEILREEVEKVLLEISPEMEPMRKKILLYYIEKDIVGLSKIQPLMNDPNIEDISCDGVGIGLYVYHRDPRLGSLKTNVMFETKDELDDFVVRLAQKCSKSISIAEPLLDASLPDGSRVQATLGTDIARKGSNFTIRRFTEKPLTPTHMMKFGTVDPIQLAYLWLAIENRQSVLVSGGSATGKTSLLNALSLFIRPSMKVVSIEDTPELRLPLPHWVPHVARTPISIEGEVGEVSLFDLLKSSLRQRPDYIIVGEVRGKEAYVLFQQIATGHSGLATIHAASFPQLLDRLTTPPISLPATLLENINVMVFLVISRLKGKSIRRADKIVEVAGVKNDKIVTNDVFHWQPSGDTFEIKEKSIVLRTLSKRLGLKEDVIKSELIRRKQILEWMLKKKIFDFKEVARVIETYYSNPEKVMNFVETS